MAKFRILYKLCDRTSLLMVYFDTRIPVLLRIPFTHKKHLDSCDYPQKVNLLLWYLKRTIGCTYLFILNPDLHIDKLCIRGKFTIELLCTGEAND